MLANYLAAALHNLSRDRLHTAITVLSLAIGFAAVILSTAFGRYEHSYDAFWPDRERIYLIAQWRQFGNGMPLKNDAAPPGTSALVAGEVPQVEAVTRISADALDMQRGETSAPEEPVYWADPNFFQVMKRPSLAGDLATALDAPGSIVLTRTLAEKYFGDEPAVGQTLLASRLQIPEPLQLRVTAVIDDLPVNGHLDGKAFISVSTIGGFPLRENEDRLWAPRSDNARTYVRVRPGVDRATLEPAVEAVGRRHLSSKEEVTLKTIPLTKVYMKDAKDDPDGGSWNEGGARSGDYGIPLQMNLIAGVILGVGIINFITLMTARGARRAVEVGVRKAAGARRRDLIIQFLGESLVYVLIAFVAALALAELAGPMLTALTGSTVDRFSWDLPMVGALFLGAIAAGVLAGAYPAFALSSYRPAQVLKGGPVKTAGSAWLRKLLISVQFVPLILLGLLVTTLTLGMMRGVVISKAVLPDDPLFLNAPCTATFKAQVLDIPGVRSTGCSGYNGWRSTENFRAVSLGQVEVGRFDTADQRTVNLYATRIPAADLTFYEPKLLAGRAPTAADESEGTGRIFLNESGMRELGIATPRAAIGKTVSWQDGRAGEGTRHVSLIEGVVADRAPAGFEELAFLPTPPPAVPTMGVAVRFTQGADRDAALATIDRIWAAGGRLRPLDRYFYHARLDEELADFWRTLRFVLTCLIVGVLVGALGLFGVAAFLAERRRKEIGVRKAMGATRGRVVIMMLREFAFPVIMANIIAVPAAWAIFTWMQRDRPVALRLPTGPDVLAPVVIGSILIALLSTGLHAWRAGSARPVTALRYE